MASKLKGRSLKDRNFFLYYSTSIRCNCQMMQANLFQYRLEEMLRTGQKTRSHEIQILFRICDTLKKDSNNKYKSCSHHHHYFRNELQVLSAFICRFQLKVLEKNLCIQN